MTVRARLRSPWLWSAALLAGLAGALRLTGLDWYDLSGDEAYHWLWSQHLALAYYDEPGAIAWVAAGSQALFGSSEMGIRMGTAVAGLAACAAFAGIAHALRGPRAAVLALLLAAAFPPLLLAARRATAQALVELAVCAAVALTVAAHRRPWLLAAAGGALGLGLWSRYTSLPVAIGLAIYLAVQRPPGWRGRWALAGALLALAGLLPSAAYGLTHGAGGLLVRVQHLSGGIGPAASLPIRALHLAEALGWPVLPVLFAGLLPGRRAWAAAWWPAVVTLSTFAIAAGDSPPDVAPGLLPAFALGVARIEAWLAPASFGRQRVARAGVGLLALEAILGLSTLVAALGLAPLPSTRIQVRDREERVWDALGPAIGSLAAGRVVETLDPDLAGLTAYYGHVPASTSYPGFADLPPAPGGDRLLISSYPGVKSQPPDADIIAGSGIGCRTIHAWEPPAANQPHGTYLDLLQQGRLGTPAAACDSTAVHAGSSYRLSARSGPGSGKTASLQKGLHDARVGEGWGLGVPIAGYGDGQVVSGSGAVVVRQGQPPAKIFGMDRLDRSYRPLALFVPIPPRGSVRVTYETGDIIAVDPSDLSRQGLHSLTAVNETGAAAAGGPAWQPFEQRAGCVRGTGGSLCAEGASGHTGQEHAPPYLDWAGVDLELPPQGQSRYRAAWHPDLVIRSRVPVLSSPALRDGLLAYGEWGPGGRLWLLDKDARPLPGWPIGYAHGVFSSPAMDGEGESLRVVVGDDEGRVHVLDRRGRELPGWPVQLGYKVWTSPTLLPGGEVVVGDRGRVHLFDAGGAELPGWPQEIDGWPIATPSFKGGAVAISTLLIGSERRGWLYQWGLDGRPMAGFPARLADDTDSSPTPLPGGGFVLGDSSGRAYRVAQDGLVQELAGRASQPVEASFTVVPGLAVIGSWDHRLRAWALPSGKLAWSAQAGDQFISSAAACSIDGVSQPDFLLGSKDGGLYAFDQHGHLKPGFPIRLGAPSFSSPWVGDLDHNGYADVVIGAADGLHIVRDVGLLGDCPWPMFRHDPAHTGAG